MIESYYISFYMVINIGALVGGIMIPIIAQTNVTIAYFIPVGALTIGLLAFVLGSKRYVREKPKKTALFNTLKVLGSAMVCKPVEKSKQSNGGMYNDRFVDGIKQLLAVIPISFLIVPFNIAYSQMTTVFIVQGEVMQPAGFMDASMMNNFDAISVLLFGFIVGTLLYPWLAKRNIVIPITYKFAVGTGFGALAILTAIIVDYEIHSALESGRRLNIFLQIFSYLLIGAGEIWAITTSYEVTFMVAPKEQKGFASAINLFFIGGLPSLICIGLYNACSPWFPKGDDSSSLEAYSKSQLYNYLWVLFGICVFGIVFNLLPPVKNWVQRVHDRAFENNKKNSREKDSSSLDKDIEVESVGTSSDDESVDSA